MMKGLPIFLAFISLTHILRASTVSPRKLSGVELTVDTLVTSFENSLKALPGQSPFAKATVEKDPTGEIINIKEGEAEVLTVRNPPGSRQIIISNREIAKMKSHLFFASFTAQTTLKTPEDLQKEVSKRLVPFDQHMKYFIKFIDEYKTALEVLKKVQALLVKNSGGLIKEDSFSDILTESLAKKNSKGVDYTTNQSSLTILGIPRIIRISVAHFAYKSFITIESANHYIKAHIVPSQEDPFQLLEEKIKKILQAIQLAVLPDLQKILEVINSAIPPECTKFGKAAVEGAETNLVQKFEFVKQFVSEAVDDEGFRRVKARRLVSPTPTFPRRLADEECVVHDGYFLVVPMFFRNFPYIHIRYNANDLYINEQLIQVSEKSVFDEKVKQFVREVNLNMETIFGKKGSKTEIPKITWKEEQMATHIIENTPGLTCDFKKQAKLDTGKQYACSTKIGNQMSKVLLVRHLKVGSNDFYEITMFEPKVQNKLPKPVKTMTYGLDQAEPSFNILAKDLQDFAKNVGK